MKRINTLQQKSLVGSLPQGTFATLMAFGLCLTASAETRLLYHFDDYAVGHETTAADRFLNAVDAATHVGIPEKSDTTSKDIFPDVVPFAEDCAIYDPVSGEMFVNTSAVHITKAGYRGSRVKIPAAADLNLQEFTIELFFAPQKPTNRSYGEYLLHKKGTLSVFRAQASSDYHYVSLSTSGGTVRWEGDLLAAGGSNSNIWNHLALVVKDHTFKVYLNYVLKKEIAFTGEVAYDDAAPLFIGSDSDQNCADVAVDEFRISDRALESSQFLRVSSVNASPETLHCYTFDNPTNFKWGVTSRYRNMAPLATASALSVIQEASNAAGVSGASKPGDIVRPGLLATVAAENVAAYHSATNDPASVAASSFFRASGATAFFADDFTFELAFRVPRQPTKAVLPEAADSAFLAFAKNWHLRFWRGTKELYFRAPGFAERVIGAYADDMWHRLAYVYEKELGAHRLIVDGELKAAWTCVAEAPFSDDWYLLGGEWGAGYTLSEGWIDDVRVTQKALRPSEFLTGLPAEGKTLAWYSFENGALDNGVYTNFIPSGTLSGAAAVTRRVPGRKLLDAEGAEIRGNAASLQLTGGTAIYPRNALLERADLTVEFFARQSSASVRAGLVTVCRSASSQPDASLAESDAMWSIRLGEDGVTPELFVNNGVGQVLAFPAGSELGNRWRHYAVALAPSGDKTSVKLYVDWELVKAGSLQGRVELPSATGGAIPMLGAISGSDAGAFNGRLDEVRISGGELGQDEFLRVPPASGLLLLLK